MSTVAFDRKAYLVEKLDEIVKSFLVNLKHIPEDKRIEGPMGVARGPLEFTAECGGFNSWAADAIGDTIAPSPDQETRKRFYATIDTLEKASDLLSASGARLKAAIEALDESELDDPTMMPWGAPSTKFKLADMAVMHMIYHDGQLSYIQSCYGDAEDHW